jgi:hypothetical protein
MSLVMALHTESLTFLHLRARGEDFTYQRAWTEVYVAFSEALVCSTACGEQVRETERPRETDSLGLRYAHWSCIETLDHVTSHRTKAGSIMVSVHFLRYIRHNLIRLIGNVSNCFFRWLVFVKLTDIYSLLSILKKMQPQANIYRVSHKFRITGLMYSVQWRSCFFMELAR